MLTWYSFLLRERSCQWQHEYFITQSFIRAVVIRSIGSPTLSYSEDPTADMSTEEIVVNCEYIGRSLGEFGGVWGAAIYYRVLFGDCVCVEFSLSGMSYNL